MQDHHPPHSNCKTTCSRSHSTRAQTPPPPQPAPQPSHHDNFEPEPEPQAQAIPIPSRDYSSAHFADEYEEQEGEAKDQAAPEEPEANADSEENELAIMTQ